jgi:hypothetical protein
MREPMTTTERWMLRVNRSTARFGVQIFPVPHMKGAAGGMRDVFDQICETNTWGSDESVSGVGSTRAHTANYVAGLVPVLKKFGIKSFFDAPCGDLNWIGALLREAPMAYSGGDISSAVIAVARKKEPDLEVRLFDICEDEFPAADVWHCRDCMFHLPLDVSMRALRNFATSKVRYALLTCNDALWLTNIDIAAGGFRPLDLRRPPFNLPPALARVKDYKVMSEFPRYVGLWSREQIAQAVGV